MTLASPYLPVSLLTGFLGSGKTTLLNRLLRDPALSETLVLVNEFGAVGLDHRLMEAVDGETVLMASGCLCCTIRSDLARTLTEAAAKRDAGTYAPFRRVVVETTGLADPAPILHAIVTDSGVRARYRLDGVIATVDLAVGGKTLDRQAEAVKQIAVADRLVLTKGDIAPPEAVAALTARLDRLNPAAPRLTPDCAAADLFAAGLYDPECGFQPAAWLRAAAYATPGLDHGHDHHDHGHDHGHDVNRHDSRITACCFTIAQPIDFDAFCLWAESLATFRGEDLLRLKAILHTLDEPNLVAIHGVQHVFHPPARLPVRPDDDPYSRIVVIARDMDRAALRDSLVESLNLAPEAIA